MSATIDSQYNESIRRFSELYHGPMIPTAQVGLARIRFMLEQLGNPEREFRSVHVAGSSGKGSTTTMIAAILQAAGFRTGLLRSPHLFDYTERISVDGQNIGREAWVGGLDVVWPLVEGMRDGSIEGYDLGRPSFSEVLFALMALHFVESGVEWAAIETGMGGRLDATNVLQSDVAVITNISLEHTKILGSTIPKIAREKAAIIKPGCHAVTASENDEALAVIAGRAEEVGVPLLRVGRDITYSTWREDIHGQDLELRNRSHLTVRLPLAGRFQATNAATAFAAVEALRRRGVPVSDDAIRRGLGTVEVPGRLEVVSYGPLVVLDGAHNPAAIEELVESVARLLAGKRIVVLFAAMADKDIRAMARRAADIAAAVVLTPPPGTDRAASPEQLAEAFSGLSIPIFVEEDVERAWSEARSLAKPDDVLLITGSLYLVGYLRHLLLGASINP